MTEIPLSKYLENHTQTEAAALIERTPAAIWQMVKKERDVRLVFNEDGSFSHPYEITSLRLPGTHPKRKKRVVKRRKTNA